MDIRVGALLWPQTDSWPELRDAARPGGPGRARHALDVGSPDAIVGPWEQPILEGWTTLAGLAAVTTTRDRSA